MPSNLQHSKLQDVYQSSQICEKLKPYDTVGGEYKLIYRSDNDSNLACYTFVFTKNHVVPATSRKAESFKHKEEYGVDLRTILPCSTISIQTTLRIFLVADEELIVPHDINRVIKRVEQALTKVGSGAMSTEPSLREDLEAVCDELKTVKEKAGSVKRVMPSELGVNTYLLEQLKESLSNTNIALDTPNCGMLVTRSSTSIPDLVMYHRANFCYKDVIRGAVVRVSAPTGSEQEDYETHVMGMMVGDLKPEKPERDLVQLTANMEKLAGELAIRALRKGDIFCKVVIYGLLFTFRDNITQVGRLEMDFLKCMTSASWTKPLTESEAPFDECLSRLVHLMEHPSAILTIT